MKRSLSGAALLLALLLLFSPCPAHAEGLAVSAHSAVFMEAETGTVLFEKNADRRLPMASTTKIMTALVALECCRQDTVVTVPKAAVGTEGTSLYLTEGEQLTVRDLLYGLLLRSANDAAVTLAFAACGSVEAFAARMNEKAEELGLSGTHFANPHGLDDDAHYTTARDLARLAAFAMQNPAFAEIVGCRQYRIRPQKGAVRPVTNHNKLLRMFGAAVGVKTGFTHKSGRCLVSAAEENGLLYVCVTLNAPDDWNDHIRLYRALSSRLCRRVFTEEGEFSVTIPVVGGKQEELLLINHSPLSAVLPQDTHVEIRAEYNHFAVAPIRRGQVLGTLLCIPDGGEPIEAELCAAEDVPAQKKKSIFQR